MLPFHFSSGSKCNAAANVWWLMYLELPLVSQCTFPHMQISANAWVTLALSPHLTSFSWVISFLSIFICHYFNQRRDTASPFLWFALFSIAKQHSVSVFVLLCRWKCGSRTGEWSGSVWREACRGMQPERRNWWMWRKKCCCLLNFQR